MASGKAWEYFIPGWSAVRITQDVINAGKNYIDNRRASDPAGIAAGGRTGNRRKKCSERGTKCGERCKAGSGADRGKRRGNGG